MHQRFADPRWVKTILCAGALLVSPVLALAAGGPVGLPSSGSGEAEATQPAFKPALHERSIEWWPFATGPVYGQLPADNAGDADVLHLTVGSFRVGDGMNIPVELTASLAGLAQGGAQYFLLQVEAGDDPGIARQTIESLGAVVMSEVPVNGLIVRLDRAAYDRVSTSPAVAFIEPYHPAFRIDPNIGKIAVGSAQEAASPIFELALTLFPGEPAAPMAALLEKLGVGVREVVVAGANQVELRVNAHASLIPQLAMLEPVQTVSEVPAIFPLAAAGARQLQSPTNTLGDFPYWQAGVDGDGQVIAVTDSGLSVDAGDFSNTRASSGWIAPGVNAGPNVPANHRKIVTYRTAGSISGGSGDLASCDALASGAFTHGQTVSGTAAGNATRDDVPAGTSPSPGAGYGAGFYDDNNGNGIFEESQDDGYDGIAKGAKVAFIDAASSCPEILFPNLNPGSLFTLLTESWKQHKASINNFSFGSDAGPTGPSYAGSAAQIDEAIAGTGTGTVNVNFFPITLSVLAAGNAGVGDEEPIAIGTQSNQAACKNCIVVGASNGVTGGAEAFTSSGYGPNRRVLNLLFAAGRDNSCISDDNNQEGSASCIDSGLQPGTSFASPNVAGAAAIVRDYFAKGFYPDGTDENASNANDQVQAISATLVKAVLIVGAQPIVGGRNVVPEDRFNFFWGYGRVQLNNSLPLAEFPTKSISGLIVHDLPNVDLDQDGDVDGVSNLALSSAGPLPTTLTTYQDEFQVVNDDEDLVAALVWNDPSNATGAVSNDVDLRVRYCGVDGTCGNGDDIVWRGNIFSEDFNRDGTRDSDLDGDGVTDGYFYTIEQRAAMTSWRDSVNNHEAVFIPTELNAPDRDEDGTTDVEFVRAGRYRVEVQRQSGTNAVYYSVAIAGPVAAGSAVRFDANPLTCNGDVSIVVTEAEDAADTACPNGSVCTESVISGRVSVDVLASDGTTVVDTENGLGFTQGDPNDPGNESLQFESERIPLSPIKAASAGDGILSVGDGQSLRVVYSDVGATRTSTTAIDCRPEFNVRIIPQIGEDFPFVFNGGTTLPRRGCDNDLYFDAGESFGFDVAYENFDPVDLIDAEVTLRAVVPYPDGTPIETILADECRLTRPDHPNVSILNPTNIVDFLPALADQIVGFALEVVGTPPTRDRVELVVSLKSEKSGQGTPDCQAFEFLMQADDDVKRYTTDCPTGCTVDYDINKDERFENRVTESAFDPDTLLNQRFDETQVVYSDLTDTSFRTVDGDGDGSPDCPECGNPGLSGPWDFNDSDEGFRVGRSVRSEISTGSGQGPITNWGEDSNWDGILEPFEDNDSDGSAGVLDRNWSIGGGCGFVSSNGNNRGAWHTGRIGQWAPADRTGVCRPNDTKCEQYDIQTGTTGAAFWFEMLRTPVLRPVRAGFDADGFQWKQQIVDWSWNTQIDIPDGNSFWTWEFDLDTTTANPTLLGDETIQFLSIGEQGAVSRGQSFITDGALVFLPTDTRQGTANYGDELLGTLGNNRTSARGCYFNNLNAADVAADPEDRLNPPRPLDDDCDNDINLVDGCPGLCGVDDDGNGAVDDIGEACPCRVCETGSPRAGQPCDIAAYCNPEGGLTFECVPNTTGAGAPIPFGDDVCGDGQVDENVNATFGTAAGLRQIRNNGIFIENGVADGGVPNGDPRFNTLDDFFGPTGQSWQGEVGFFAGEPQPGSDPAVTGYGMAIDDMVVEWVETHPIAQAIGNVCNAGQNPDYDGQCASIALGVAFNTNDGDGQIPVTIVDFNAATTANAVDCNGDGTAAEVQVEAFSEAELVPELVCLEQVSPGSIQYRGQINTTTRIAANGDGLVYLAYNLADTPSVTARYIDKDDGKRAISVGPDGQPGIAGVDDDGDGTIDDADELCPISTQLAAGRSPHNPGQEARYSDDSCGCPGNPLLAGTFAAFDPADVLIYDYTIDDSGCAGCDNDGYPDPGEDVTMNITIRNLSSFPLENIQLTAASDSDLVDCISDDRVTIARLGKNGDPDDTFTTSVDSFQFSAAAGVSRSSVSQKFGSTWTIAMNALARAEAGTPLSVDLPISGTLTIQRFFVPHNLNAPSTTAAADFVDTFETYTSDANLRATYRVRVTGDDAEELDGTRCQVNDPANPFGNNVDPNNFCELGEGFDNLEEHWSLSAPSAPVGQTVCDDPFGCPNGGKSMPGGVKSMSNANTVEANPFDPDGHTIDINRMNWVQTGRNFQLGLGNPEFEYWTQMSLLTSALLGGGANDNWTFDVGMVYLCVDANNNTECDTGEQPGGLDAGEFWEPLRAYFTPEAQYRRNNSINCMYDPSDDGNNEDDLFPNAVDQGPSSTCWPGNPVSGCAGRTRDEDLQGGLAVFVGSYCWGETGQEDSEIAQAGATINPANLNAGVWVRKAYKLDPWRGQKVIFRWHVAPGAVQGVDNIADVLDVFGANLDDGWWIDNVKVSGLANNFALTTDNTGSASATCGSLVNCSTVTTRVAALPYPRNDRQGNPKAALSCTDQTLEFCDFDGDGVVDTANSDPTSDAPGRSLYLESRFTEADACLGGALEYRVLDLTAGTVVKDWVTDPLILVNPASDTTFRVEARCSSSLTCIDSQDVTVTVTGGAAPTCRASNLLLATNKQSITWTADPASACPALFDTLRGTGTNFGSGTCLENDGNDTSSLDASTPSLGSMFWYLARHSGDTYSTGAAGEQDRSGITGCP